jgi:hypothetical protein
MPFRDLLELPAFKDDSNVTITTQTLKPYVGGQVEIQNASKGYLYRGEIEDVEVQNGNMVVTFAWMAKGIDFPPVPSGWRLLSSTLYGVRLSRFDAKNLGPGEVGGDRLGLISNDETIVFFPPDGSKLQKPS